jgi:FAD/FMN-containing dehydrogenase
MEEDVLFEMSKIRNFADNFSGQLIHPGNPDYDNARKIWNGMVDRCPALIARCGNANDIINAVKFAREHDLAVSVRGGGHSVAGRSVCEGGLMIDLSGMKAVKVDPDKQTAHVEPGAILADMDGATQKHGLATTGGLVSETGVAGLTLGGGLGYLARRFGLTIDNLISADVVTADGKLIRASKEENPDLFWALRGGGGNFGIVTSFQFRLHKVGPDVLAAQIFYPYEDAERVLNAYRDIMAEAPDELSCYALAANVPPADPFPEEYHGKTAIALVGCYSGAHEDGLKLLEPLQKLGNPILDVLAPMPYAALQQSFDAGMPDGGRYYWKGNYVNEISDEAIKTFVANINPLPGIFTLVGFEPMGGAVSRVEPQATAFPHRDANFALGIWAGWTDPSDDDEIISWTRRFHQIMEPYTTGGVYANYLDQDDDGRVKNAYGSNFERLKKIKAKYDPDNFFRNNHNISPEK